MLGRIGCCSDTGTRWIVFFERLGMGGVLGFLRSLRGLGEELGVEMFVDPVVNARSVIF